MLQSALLPVETANVEQSVNQPAPATVSRTNQVQALLDVELAYIGGGTGVSNLL